MPKKNEVPMELRKEIMRLRLEGKSFGQIEVATGVPRSTCFRIVDRFSRRGVLHNAPRSGRPPKLSLRDSRILIREFMKNPHAPMADIVKGSGVNISVTSAYRYKKQLGIALRVIPKKPWLNRRMRRQRFKWCYSNWGWNWTDVRKRI